MSRLTSKLRNRIEVLTRKPVENVLGEWEYKYAPLKTIYGQIISQRSSVKDGQADTQYVESTHKIKVRKLSLPYLDNTYRFKYKEQTHKVEYFNPDFQNNEFYEIFTKLVTE